jgi:hypothetical protein
MTIYQLKALNAANGGLFFERSKTKGVNRLSNLKVSKHSEDILVVTYKRGSNRVHYFCAKTGRIIFPEGMPLRA